MGGEDARDENSQRGEGRDEGPERGSVPAHCLTYGRPTAAGPRERPTTPTSAISVRMYGRVWRRLDEMPASFWRRCASPLEKPKSRHAAKAGNGLHLPKMTAASAM